jgi:glycosyltransferase involved in cell wall biosynthesis
MSPPPALIVFSHLRWDFVFQRPQHLLSRLAKHYRVFFIEEPMRSAGPPRLDVRVAAPNIHVCQPHTSVDAPGFDTRQVPVLQELVDGLVSRERLTNPLVWLYTPMALPLTRSLNPRVLVYDCMDELAAFMNAPDELVQRENALLRSADLVFTGGPSIYKSKQHRHPSVHCFPSSVDASHFGRGMDAGASHPAQAHIAGPRLGFYGVIDERFDLPLLDEVAALRPEWQLVMVGPVVKIDPATLPRRDNIHYLGQQSYEDLPAFLAGWDVCLLPFALNKATRFISPTKTLEYMAAAKPIVTTPVTDVVVPYGHIVHSANSATGFVACCEQALQLTPEALHKMARQMRDVLSRTSWDATAARMRDLMEAAAGTSAVAKVSGAHANRRMPVPAALAGLGRTQSAP